MSDESTPTPMHPDLEHRIKRAEAAIAIIRPKFQEALVLDVARLGELADAGPGDETMAGLRALAHDIKGNAGGFGFALVSDIAECLNAYLDAIASLGPQDAEIIHDHCNSMTIAVNEPLDAEQSRQIEEFIRLSQQLNTDARET